MNERVMTPRQGEGTVVQVFENCCEEGDQWLIRLDRGGFAVIEATSCRVLCPETDYEDGRNHG